VVCLKTYTTSEIARRFNIHPNTVRLYEEIGFITKPERKKNGYRIFTTLHIQQLVLVRLALKCELVQNGLRQEAVEIIRLTASGMLASAGESAEKYLHNIRKEIVMAQEALEIAKNITAAPYAKMVLTRKQTADKLGITIDTLRNWEMNGLLRVKRRQNGYRIYNSEDVKKLKIIRCLRNANYSLTAILRLLNDMTQSTNIDFIKSIDTPKESEEIVSVCDRLITSLTNAEKDALSIIKQIEIIKKINPPL
jgi:DNA-binding transcriptional MerR regulator